MQEAYCASCGYTKKDAQLTWIIAPWEKAQGKTQSRGGTVSEYMTPPCEREWTEDERRWCERVRSIVARAEAARVKLEATEKREADLLNMLRRLEWIGGGRCPECLFWKTKVKPYHAPGCELAELLKEKDPNK